MKKENFIKNIKNNKLTIYDPIEIGDKKLWIPTKELQNILLREICGISLKGLPLRTRSKVVKSEVCKALGYPIPKSFKKTKPRFSGQNFDTYSQKRNNLQVWNNDIEPTQRYVILQISEDDVISNVKVCTGKELAKLDKTGTLTQKFQARLDVGDKECELISKTDTSNLEKLTKKYDSKIKPNKCNPTDQLIIGSLIPINEIFNILKSLIGFKFQDVGADQERNRGAALHKIVCEKLAYISYADNGQFPDIRNQLLEVKLQTSPTIDLGLVIPDSTEPLDIIKINGITVRHCDVRYAIFYAKINNGYIEIKNFFLTTGEDFFTRFKQFQGRVINKKRQLILPRTFFDI